jgi:hypothetical protein
MKIYMTLFCVILAVSCGRKRSVNPVTGSAGQNNANAGCVGADCATQQSSTTIIATSGGSISGSGSSLSLSVTANTVSLAASNGSSASGQFGMAIKQVPQGWSEVADNVDGAITLQGAGSGTLMLLVRDMAACNNAKLTTCKDNKETFSQFDQTFSITMSAGDTSTSQSTSTPTNQSTCNNSNSNNSGTIVIGGLNCN